MHLFCSGLAQLYASRFAGSAAHDRVIDNDDPFSVDELTDQVELHVDRRLTPILGWSYEAPSCVVISHKCHHVRDPSGACKAQSGIIAAIRDRYDDVRCQWILHCQCSSHIHTNNGCFPSVDQAVRASEVDGLESAKCVLLHLALGMQALQSPVAYDRYLSRLELPHERRFGSVECACFAGKDPGFAQSPECQRAEAVRVAHGYELVCRHDDERIGAFNLIHHVEHRLFQRLVGPGYQMQHHFAVSRCLEDGAGFGQSVSQAVSVSEVAIMCQGDLTELAVDHYRLGVRELGTSSRRIPVVSDGHVAGESLQDAVIEDVEN